MHYITKLICKKNKISYIVFTKEFKIVEFNEDAKNVVDSMNHLSKGSDIRDAMWELVGIEESLNNLFSGIVQENLIHFPMVIKRDIYYDLDIETFISPENEKLFIAYFMQKPKESLNYINMIKEINKKTLIYENQLKSTEKSQYDYLNKKLLSFNVDMDGHLTDVNSVFSLFFDISKEKIIGKHFSKFFKARDLNFRANSAIIFNAINKKGELISFHADIIPLSEDGKVYENIIICQDITYLKQIERELEFAAGHDALTNLVNRTHLLNKVDEAIEYADKNSSAFTLCFIDINGFQEINDTYGHHAGDMLLKHVAKFLSDFVRKVDTVARVSGDEFVILFDMLSKDEYIDAALSRLEELPKKNALTYTPEDTIKFNFSIGKASYPQDAKNARELLIKAKERMITHKRGNKKQF